jgi:hypothetical protein
MPVNANVVLHQSRSGSRLHRSHNATAHGEPSLAGLSPRAQGEGSATDNDRVGNHQPLPSGSIGGPWELRGSNGAPIAEATRTTRHSIRSAAAPRPGARSSASNLRVSELADDSAARVDSVGAPPKARRRDARPAISDGTTSGHERDRDSSASRTTTSIGIDGESAWATAGAVDVRQAGGSPSPAVNRAPSMSASAVVVMVATDNRRFGVREQTPPGVLSVP